MSKNESSGINVNVNTKSSWDRLKAIVGVGVIGFVAVKLYGCAQELPSVHGDENIAMIAALKNINAANKLINITSNGDAKATLEAEAYLKVGNDKIHLPIDEKFGAEDSGQLQVTYNGALELDDVTAPDGKTELVLSIDPRDIGVQRANDVPTILPAQISPFVKALDTIGVNVGFEAAETAALNLADNNFVTSCAPELFEPSEIVSTLVSAERPIIQSVAATVINKAVKAQIIDMSKGQITGQFLQYGIQTSPNEAEKEVESTLPAEPKDAEVSSGPVSVDLNFVEADCNVSQEAINGRNVINNQPGYSVAYDPISGFAYRVIPDQIRNTTGKAGS